MATYSQNQLTRFQQLDERAADVVATSLTERADAAETPPEEPPALWTLARQVWDLYQDLRKELSSIKRREVLAVALAIIKEAVGLYLKTRRA